MGYPKTIAEEFDRLFDEGEDEDVVSRALTVCRGSPRSAPTS